jgi:hypothetical protein
MGNAEWYSRTSSTHIKVQLCEGFDLLRKTAFLSHLYIKANILPRQARDKQWENSKRCRCRAPGSQRVQSLASLGQYALRKTHLSFLSGFPMFVPSLSWENDAFYIYMASQKVAFLYLWRRVVQPAALVRGRNNEDAHIVLSCGHHRRHVVCLIFTKMHAEDSQKTSARFEL